MPFKMTVYYHPVDDAEAFEKRYLDGHLPLARAKYANMQASSFHKATRTLMGEFPQVYAFTGTWADLDSWRADMVSDGGREVAEDAAQMAAETGAKFDVVTWDQLA